MPRFCLVNHVTSVELHSFSDASIKALTDSITALFWIKGVDKEFKQFVENRVAGIRKKDRY